MLLVSGREVKLKEHMRFKYVFFDQLRGMIVRKGLDESQVKWYSLDLREGIFHGNTEWLSDNDIEIIEQQGDYNE